MKSWCFLPVVGLVSIFVASAQASAPILTAPLQSQTNVARGTAVFTIQAESASPLSYSWYILGGAEKVTNNGSSSCGNVSGINTASLVISNLQWNWHGLNQPYRVCVCVSNAHGSAFSSAGLRVLGYIEDKINRYKPGDPPISLPAGTFPEVVRINKDVVIEGAGQGLTVLQNSNRYSTSLKALVTIEVSNSVTLKNLTVRGNIYSGQSGIANQGVLNLENATIENNNAGVYVPDGGGIHNSGTAHLANVTIQRNWSYSMGGGVWNQGLITFTNCIISSNSQYNGETAGYGSGIYNQGTCILDHSIIFGNYGSEWGGGVLNYQNLIVNQSVISSNRAPFGAGIANWGSSLIINQSLICSNSGIHGSAIHNSGPLAMTNSTISANGRSGGGSAIVNSCAGVLASCTVCSNHGVGILEFNPTTPTPLELKGTLTSENKQ